MRKTGPDADEPEVQAVDPSALARLASAGDPAATVQLLKQVTPEMHRLVRGVMGPYAADVDDVVQQALIGLVQALPHFRGECAPAGYACRIALRTALAARKKARASTMRHDNAAETEGLPGGHCPGDAYDTYRRTELLRGLLNEIPLEQAEAITLRTMLGWSLEEIAKAGAAPVNTIRSRLRLAKEALLRKIEADPSIAEELGVRG